MCQLVDVDEQLGRCRPSFRRCHTCQTPPTTSPGMITALAGISGCQAGSLTKCRRQCTSGTRVQPLTRLACATGLTSSNRLRRTSHCRAQASAAAVAPSPHMPVRLWRTGASSSDAAAAARCAQLYASYDAPVTLVVGACRRAWSLRLERVTCSASGTGRRGGNIGTGRTA